MSRAGDLFDRMVPLVVNVSAIKFFDPKLPHRNRGRAMKFQRIEPVGMGSSDRPTGLRMRPQQSALFRQGIQPTIVIFRDQIADGNAKILQKGLGGCCVVDLPTTKCRQPFLRVVSSAFQEFLRHPDGPIRLLDLPTIDVQVLKRLARQRTRILDHLRARIGKVQVHRLGTHWIDFQTRRSLKVSGDALTIRLIANAENAPVASRRIPDQPPLGVHELRYIHNLIALPDLCFARETVWDRAG